MDSRKTLLSPTDVTRFTPIKLPFNACSFRELYSIEYSEARTVIGFELWKSMLEVLAKYTNAQTYEVGTSYLQGTVVKFGGSYKRALSETNRQPDFASDWEEAPKFEGPCASFYDELFCLHLAPYLSFTVLARRFQYIIAQISDGGLTYAGKQYNSEDTKLINGLKTAIFGDRAEAFSNLQHYLSDNSDNSDCTVGWIGKQEKLCGCKSVSCNSCNPSTNKPPGHYEYG